MVKWSNGQFLWSNGQTHPDSEEVLLGEFLHEGLEVVLDPVFELILSIGVDGGVNRLVLERSVHHNVTHAAKSHFAGPLQILQ